MTEYVQGTHKTCFTGMRVNELLALTHEHIDLEAKKIYVRQNVITAGARFCDSRYTATISTPKTRSSVRDISMPDRVFEIIKTIYERDYQTFGFEPKWFVFSKAKTEPHSYASLINAYRKISLASTLHPIRMHDLRHSHASLLINMGADSLLVKSRLGHASVQTTLDTYSHFYPEHEDTILMKLNSISKKKEHSFER